MTFQSNIRRASSYQSVAKESRVLSATPYELVTVLFSELRGNLDLMIESTKRGDNGKMFEFRARALAILNGLDESLNFDVAGGLGTDSSHDLHRGRCQNSGGGWGHPNPEGRICEGNAL